MKLKPEYAFYFAHPSGRLNRGDGREIRTGESHTVSGDIVLCRNGLHWSRRVIDALSHANSFDLYVVRPFGRIIEGRDKSESEGREYCLRIDAREVVLAWIKAEALASVHLIQPYCSEEEFATVKGFLETGRGAWAAAHAAHSATYVTYAAADACYAAHSAYAAAWAAAHAANSAPATAYAAARAARADAYADARLLAALLAHVPALAEYLEPESIKEQPQ